MKKCIIIANGDLPRKKHIEVLKQRKFDTIICADGGANSAHKINVIPDYIIGDFDSITDETKKIFFNKSKIIPIRRQNDTDVEKCLKFAIKNKFTEAILLGATGDRLDHTICNLGIVLKFYQKIKIKIVHHKSLLIPISGEMEIKTTKGETISLYGFDDKTLITSVGLKYKLKNDSLPFGKKESTSNVAISDLIHLKVENGIIFLIRDFESARVNDFV